MKKEKPVQRVAVLHDLCSVGKAAMTNILPVLSVMGIEACPIPTMILSTHTGGFGKPVIETLPAFPVNCAEHLKKQGMSFEHIFAGYLGNLEMVQNLQEFLEYYPDARVLLDPIMADHGKYYSNFNEEYGRAIRGILRYSHLITPNYTESCILASVAYETPCTREKLWQICKKLTALGAAQIVITSVPLTETNMAIALYDTEKLEILEYEPAGRAYPGTGDLFAAVLQGYLIKGNTLDAAVQKAHRFVCRCIRKSDAYGYPVREGILLESNLKSLCSDTEE